MSSAKIRFVDPNKSQFFFTVKQNVDEYFKKNNLSKHANASMIAKSIFFFGGVWVLYGLILSNQFTPLTMLVLAMLLGMFKAMVGFNISHDAIHGSYSSNAFVNKLLGYSFSVLGANQSVWIQSHNIVHHTYTNIPEHDEDLIVAPGLLRLTEGDKKAKIQKFQHLYGFFLYSFASISWVFRKDFIKFFQKKIGQTENRFTARDTFELFFFKILYIVIFILVPLIVLKDITVLQFVLGFLAMHFTMGLTLGLVFQLAHVVEQTEYPTPTEIGHIEEAWAVHQMKTTANFGVGSWLTTFLCGGLNHQVEHHLFPKICHIHYPEISKIVRETAIEHGVPYIENKTFFTALKSHYNILKKYSLEV
jgi:linoleoyl-CoA desaturase